MTRLVLATRNADKVRELRKLFAGLRLESIASAAELDLPDVIEDGETLEENALKKAREIAVSCGLICIADDTGLEVDALGGAPGVYSARFAGENCSYEDNWRKLLSELKGIPPEGRTAHFRTVMVLVDPVRGVERRCDGVLSGRITESPRGDGGFGYDPVFELDDTGRTLAELTLEEKNGVSHRGRAARAMRSLLEGHLRGENQVGA